VAGRLALSVGQLSEDKAITFHKQESRNGTQIYIFFSAFKNFFS